LPGAAAHGRAPLFLNDKGLIMDVFTDLGKPFNYLSNIKSCNSLTYVMAGIYKSQNKLDDVFILNQNKLLCEAGSSERFCLYDNHLYTPALKRRVCGRGDAAGGN
jgi:branched-chain amino acid aminotransferase